MNIYYILYNHIHLTSIINKIIAYKMELYCQKMNYFHYLIKIVSLIFNLQIRNYHFHLILIDFINFIILDTLIVIDHISFYFILFIFAFLLL